MTVRTTRKTVTFRHPFTLKGADGVQPAGTYTVEIDEEQIPNLSFVAYRRLSTTIVLSADYGGATVRQSVAVEPADLEEAQAHDELAEAAKVHIASSP